MDEFKCPVVQIPEIVKHPNADTLGIVTVEGTVCIVRLGDFQPGDLAVLVPLDSLVPTSRHEFAFLAKGDVSKTVARVKAMKLRGTFSDGLVVKNPGLKLGQDAAGVLGITKWSPGEMGASISYTEPNKGWLNKVRRAFMTWFLGFAFIRKLFGVRNRPSFKSGERPKFYLSSGKECPTYGLDKYAKYRNLLDNQEIWVSEKIHGCLRTDTPINMADGTKKEIQNIEVGDEVLGVDISTMTIVPTKVLRVYDNGLGSDWLKIKVQTNERGTQARFVECTPEHRFYCPELKDFRLAGDLHVGDSVILSHSRDDISELQQQVLLGKMLGDGSLCVLPNTASISFGHRIEDLEYLRWTTRALGDICAPKCEEHHTSGYGTSMVRSRTVGLRSIKAHFEDFVKSGKKSVPDWVAGAVSPISLAFWYMDDGSLSHNEGQEDRVQFATCAFSMEDCAVLIRGLSRFGIEARTTNRDYPRIGLNAANAEKFFLLVAPYIPRVMERKLPERYRGGEGWIPSLEGCRYFNKLKISRVLSIQDCRTVKYRTSRCKKMDLETEIHNYLANGILVHNSNHRLVKDGTEVFVGSHYTVRRQEDSDTYWKAAQSVDLVAKLANDRDLIVFGEVIGVQDLKYGCEKDAPGYRAFDVLDLKAGRYLDFDQFQEFCKTREIPMVPVLYRGPHDPAVVESLTNAKKPLMSVIDSKTLREGVVIKPTQEPDDYRVRMALKHVSQHYLMRADGTEYK